MDGDSLFIGRRVALLAGGDSAEREVSIASGRQVELALSEAGWSPVLIDPAEVELSAVDWSAFDVCFVALHGGAGEDGRIQQQLEQFGVPYTGSGPAASRLAMSKSAAKERFAESGVASLPYMVISAAGTKGIEKKLEAIGFPLVVKPDGQGSSLGVNVASGPDDLVRSLAESARYDSYAVIEPFVLGREFTISLLGRDPLPMIEIVAAQRLFTYEAKYSSPATEYRLDSKLPGSVEAELYRTAVAAAEALGTAGLVRVDLMLDENQRPWVLEVNTIPGMTERSLSPRAARGAGMEMPALVDWIVRDAIQRSRTAAGRPVNLESL
jgi:D-alanine-D-alanine ligase